MLPENGRVGADSMPHSFRERDRSVKRMAPHNAPADTLQHVVPWELRVPTLCITAILR